MSVGRFEFEPLEAAASEALLLREEKRCLAMAEACTVDRERAYWMSRAEACGRMADAFRDGPPITPPTPRLDLNSAEARQNGNN